MQCEVIGAMLMPLERYESGVQSAEFGVEMKASLNQKRTIGRMDTGRQLAVVSCQWSVVSG